MTPSAATREDRATAFAVAVRKHLRDLPADEIDELLDGLQADLAERLADGGELGNPADYADELRHAAGLPSRDSHLLGSPRRRWGELIDSFGSGLAERVRVFWDATPVRQAIRDFILALRPLWWVMRGIVASFVAVSILVALTSSTGLSFSNRIFISLPYALATLFCVVVSVQWGRGVWAPNRFVVWLRRLISVVAVLAIAPTLGYVWGQYVASVYHDAADSAPGYQPGLHLDDTNVGNIFAYDCNGQLLDGVQLFTRNGLPLTTLRGEDAAEFYDEATGEVYQYQRHSLAVLSNGWNVYPLQQAKRNMSTGELSAPQAVPAPFAEVPRLSSDCAAASPDVEQAAADAESPAAQDSEATQDSESTAETGAKAGHAATARVGTLNEDETEGTS